MAGIFPGGSTAGGRSGDGLGQELTFLQTQEALGGGADEAGGLSPAKGEGEAGTEFFAQSVECLERLPGVLGPQFDFPGEDNFFKVTPGDFLNRLLDGRFVLSLWSL